MKVIAFVFGLVLLAGFIAFLTVENLPNPARDFQLATDEQNLKTAEAAQTAELDKKLRDANVTGMLLHGAMSEGEAAVDEECQEAHSVTPVCKRLAARVDRWTKAHAGDYDKQLRAEGVKQ